MKTAKAEGRPGSRQGEEGRGVRGVNLGWVTEPNSEGARELDGLINTLKYEKETKSEENKDIKTQI